MTGLYKNTILTEDEAKGVAKLLNAHESVTTLWLPGSGRTYLGQSFQNTDFFKEVIPNQAVKDLIVVYIDQEIGLQFIETHILGNLSQYGSFSMVTEALFSLIKKGHQIVFTIDNFHLDRVFFNYLNSLRNVSIDKINFVFMILQSDFEHLKAEYPDSTSLIYHNIIPVAYFTSIETTEWAYYTVNKLGVNIQPKVVRQMVKFTGGIPLLIENYIRFFKIYGSHESVIASQEMRILLLKLVGLFTKAEREVMEALVTKNKMKKRHDLTGSQSRIIEYFNTLGLIDEQEKFSGEWVGQYFGGYRTSPLVLQRGRVYINDVDLTYQFTEKDISCLNLMKNQDVVTREEIFNSIDKVGKAYSDWAIDKFISRLRKKLKKAGLSKKMVMTVRGKGYRLKD